MVLQANENLVEDPLSPSQCISPDLRQLLLLNVSSTKVLDDNMLYGTLHTKAVYLPFTHRKTVRVGPEVGPNNSQRPAPSGI